MYVLQRFMLVALSCLPLAATAADPASGEDQELAAIIEHFAKRTGRKFILDPRVRAMPGFAGIDPDKITYEQLLATLATNMFATYAQGDYIVVVPDANARQMPTPVYSALGFKADANEIVTLVLTPKQACAPHLVPILRPLMPQAAHMAADLGSNSLILSDRVGNLRRIADLVDRLDKAATGKQACGGEKSGS